MQYFVFEKICENACKLTLIGESFDDASEYVVSLNKNERKEVYIVPSSRVKRIFFDGFSEEHMCKYWKENSRRITERSPLFLYIPLPCNYKELLRFSITLSPVVTKSQTD